MTRPTRSLDVSCLAAEDVRSALRSIYGAAFSERSGTVHVVAVWQSPDGYRVLRIGPHSPRSTIDFFLLNATRARSDAIVTTGKILREEPAVRHDLAGDGHGGAALMAYRREVVGLEEPPVLAVLSSGRDLDLGHPAFHSWARPLVVTGEEGKQRLAKQAGGEVEVVARPEPSIRDTLDLLAGRGCARIAVEAGPSTALELYRSPGRVDELRLSVFEGGIHPEARGASFPRPEGAELQLVRAGEPVRCEQVSGVWRFECWRRTEAR